MVESSRLEQPTFSSTQRIVPRRPLLLYKSSTGSEDPQNEQLQVWSGPNWPQLRDDGAWWGYQKPSWLNCRRFQHRKVGPNVRNRRLERQLQGLGIVHVQIKPEVRVVYPIISKKELEFRRQHLVWSASSQRKLAPLHDEKHRRSNILGILVEALHQP